MKKFLLLTLFSYLFSSAHAQQLTSLQFEDWTNITGCTSIDSASQFTNTAIEAFRINNKCLTSPGVYKSTDSYAGTNAMKLSQVLFNTVPLSSKANLAISLGGIKVPFAYSPKTLKGYYKYTKGGTDTIAIIVKAFAGTTVKGTATFSSSASTSGYQMFEITLDYVDQTTIDGITVELILSNANDEADAASELLVDAFEFTYNNTSTISSSELIKVINTENELVFSESVEDVNFYDVLGMSQKTVKSSTQNISTQALQNGVYVVTYQYKNNYYSKKIMINR